MKKMQKQAAMLAANVALAMFATGCATFGSKQAGGGDVQQDVVVTQAGKDAPVIAAHDRRYFLDMRQSKAALPKMRGTLATGETDAAVEMARAYLAKRPGDADGLAMLATALIMNKRYDLAAYYASLLERARPGDATAMNVKGLAAMMTPKGRAADYRRAAEYFQAAFETDGQIAAGLNLGNLQLELGNATAASGTFQQVADRCGRCIVSLMGLGVASSRSGKYDAAATAFNEILAKNPNHGGALYNLALVHKNGYNNKKQAEKYLETMLAKSRTQDGYLKERAYTVLRMVKGEASVEERTRLAGDSAASAGDAELLMSDVDSEDAVPAAK